MTLHEILECDSISSSLVRVLLSDIHDIYCMGISYKYILQLNELLTHLLPRSFIYKKDLAYSQLPPKCMWLANLTECILNSISQQ